MKRFFTLALLLALLSPVCAQEGKIMGVVRDKVSGENLAGANIILPVLRAGATSDVNGEFILEKISPGTYTLVVTYLGYTEVKRTIDVPENQTVHVMVEMIPTPLKGKEVTVVATRAVEGETPAAFSTLSNEDIETRYYAQDVPVMLSELPSTTYYSESGNGVGYNYLSIRGFNQRRISVMINGIPQNDPEDHNVYWLDFPDFLANVDDIQVQRGAGSAFYGPPAIGGSINIISSRFCICRRLLLAWWCMVPILIVLRVGFM